MKTIHDLDFKVSKEIENYTAHSAEIAIMISNYIQSNGMTKRTFADLVGKTASDITRWVSGSHNFTILTLSLIEARTGMEIIKKLSKENILSFRNLKVFEVRNEIQLLKEINDLKHKVEEMKVNLVYSQINLHGIYENEKSKYDFKSILTGDEKSTLDLTDNYVRKIKGNKIFKGKLCYS